MFFTINPATNRFHEIKTFHPDELVIDAAVRSLCEQNACGHYGRNHMCPPAIQDIQACAKYIRSYKNGYLVTKVYPTASRFDLKAMQRGAVDFHQNLLTLKTAFARQYPFQKTLLLGAGACLLCNSCTFSEGKPCRFPLKAVPSLEAMGIDVIRLSKSVGMRYHNGKGTITYFGALLHQ